MWLVPQNRGENFLSQRCPSSEGLGNTGNDWSDACVQEEGYREKCSDTHLWAGTCRVSQQGGFGMDSPQKQPQQQQKLQSFMEVWFWDGFTLKTILSQKPWFCFWQFAVQNYFNNKLDFNCLINFTLLTSPTAGSHWEICDPCRILGQRKSCFIVFWRIIPGKPIAWHSILI